MPLPIGHRGRNGHVVRCGCRPRQFGCERRFVASTGCLVRSWRGRPHRRREMGPGMVVGEAGVASRPNQCAVSE